MAKRVLAQKTSRGAKQRTKVIGERRSSRLLGNAVEYVGRLATRDVLGTSGELLDSVERAERALDAGQPRAALGHAFDASERLVEMARRGGPRSDEMTQVAERAKAVVMRVLSQAVGP